MVVALTTLISLSSLKTGITTALYFLPGWIVYFGWLTIAKGEKPAPLSSRAFWLISAGVNFAYFAHEFRPWNWLTGSEVSLNVAGYWWLFTGLLSLVFSFATKNCEAGR